MERVSAPRVGLERHQPVRAGPGDRRVLRRLRREMQPDHHERICRGRIQIRAQSS